jgi:uncharacterized protein
MKIMEWIIRWRKALTVVMVLLSVLFAWYAKSTKVDFSFDSFNPAKENETVFYKVYRRTFPHADNGILIAFENKTGKGIWDAPFLTRVDSFFADLQNIPHLDTVISPTRLQQYRRQGMGMTQRPLLTWDSDSALVQSQGRLREDSLLYSNFFSEDRSLLAGLVAVDTAILDLPLRDSVSLAIRARLERSGLSHVASGVPYIRTQYVERIVTELTWFLAFSVVLALIVMFWLYRNWWGILLPQITVLLTLVWMLGLMAMMGQGLDLMSELLPSILFVVGISDTVHLMTSYQQNLQAGIGKVEAMQATLNEVGVAAFLTCITTAIGFGTMYFSPMPPLQNFGFFAAASVVFAYLITMAVLPSVLLALPQEKIVRSRGFSNNPVWESTLLRVNDFVGRQTRPIALGFLGLLILSGIGISMISTNTYLLDDIHEDDPAKVSMRFFEEKFYGTRSFEVAVVAAPGKSVSDLDILQDMDKIEQYVRSQGRISPFLSLSGYLKTANRLTRGGSDRFYKLPGSQDKVEELIGFAYTSNAASALGQVMEPERRVARMSARMGDIGTDAFNQLKQGLDTFINKECNAANFSYHLTGNAIIAERNVQVMRDGLLEDIFWSFTMISLVMGLLFKNWRMLIVAIIPNVIPLIVTAGVMGFLGITLRASTSIVFLVSFGIAVDDTIHFLSRFRMELKEGHDREKALRNTIIGTGKAMLITGLILLSGFMFLLTSDFGATFVVGLFTALTLAVAMVSDMLLLPILIRWARIGPDAPTKSSLENAAPTALETEIVG